MGWVGLVGFRSHNFSVAGLACLNVWFFFRWLVADAPLVGGLEPGLDLDLNFWLKSGNAVVVRIVGGKHGA